SKQPTLPVRTKVNPRVRKAAVFEVAVESMNCGRKARKKRATLGFKMLVKMPWRKAATGSPCLNFAFTSRRYSRWNNARRPRKMRYIAPASFTAEKAQAEVARSADSPNAAAHV